MRRTSPERRDALALALSGLVIGLAKRALRDAHPDATDGDRAVLFLRLHHGAETAIGLRALLDQLRG